MKTKRTLKPGQPGTKKLVKIYGDRLFCVRYRYDEENACRYTTIELIIASSHWEPIKIHPHDIVGVAIAVGETKLQSLARRAGGIWNPHKGWIEMKYADALRLGLKSRIIPDTLK